jgi:hypothetical protein
MGRLARRKDTNHNEIQAAFERLGCVCFDTSRTGYGFPDLAVSHKGATILVEVKDGSLKPSARRLTKDEQTFFDNWAGVAVVVSSLEDVINVFNVYLRGF